MNLTNAELADTVTKSDGRVFLVAGEGRVAAAAFVAAIEWYWYAPGTTRNRFYDVYTTEWANLGWAVVAFPAGRFPAVKRLAKQLGLRIADGVPTLMEASQAMHILASARPRADLPAPKFFPGASLPNGRNNPAIWTIENDHGSPVYTASRRDQAAMLQATEEINEALNRGVKLTPSEIADYIYGPGFPAST